MNGWFILVKLTVFSGTVLTKIDVIIDQPVGGEGSPVQLNE